MSIWFVATVFFTVMIAISQIQVIRYCTIRNHHSMINNFINHDFHFNYVPYEEQGHIGVSQH